MSELELIINEDDPDVIFITESLPKNHIGVCEITELSIDGYQAFVNDKPKRGAIVYVKKDLECIQLTKVWL